jgi:hypothetical protein
MTPQPYSIFSAHQHENDIVLQIIALFGLFPNLTRFSVGDPESDAPGREGRLAVRDLGFCGFAKEDEGEVRHRIGDLLAEFVQRRPEMLELLSGRTFSRTLHQLDTRQVQAQQRN